MPYVPPHLRVSQDGRRPTPVAPPSSVGQSQLHSRSNRELLPDVNIQKSPNFIRRGIIVSFHHVEFAKFEGDTYAHLHHRQLYTLKPASTGDDASSSKDINELVDGLSLQQSQQPGRFIVGALCEDFRELLEKFKQYPSVESASRVVPLMKLRVGKLLCHARSGLFDWQKIFMPKEVEMCLERGDLSWTFDNCISEEQFTFLHELAHKSSSQTWLKEKFIIQVRTSPVRHMISDFACIGKNHDVRVAFYTKDYVTGLTEDELCDLKSCISKASVDDTVKGGLRWPLGSKHSTSGRFKVVGSVHDRETHVIDGSLRWYFRKCNRVEFKASSGRISYEAAIRPVIYHEFCKGHKEHTVEELMLSFEDLLQRVWADCLS